MRIGRLCYNIHPYLDRGGRLLEAIDVAHRVVEVASEKQASDIVLLDMGGVASFADYFVLLSADTARQMKAVYEDILHVLKKDGVLPGHTEGSSNSGWLLIDYTDVIVHIFAPLERAYYQLDDLWREARPVVRIQ